MCYFSPVFFTCCMSSNAGAQQISRAFYQAGNTKTADCIICNLLPTRSSEFKQGHFNTAHCFIEPTLSGHGCNNNNTTTTTNQKSRIGSVSFVIVLDVCMLWIWIKHETDFYGCLDTSRPFSRSLCSENDYNNM